MVSVIVPVYNVERHLPACIESVLGQTYSDWELLLVDDGSTDRSGKICDEYAEQNNRIRVFHKENGGVSSARNMGLDNAKGEFIAFLDADDYLDSDLYEQALLSIGKNDVLFFHYSMDENGKIYKVHQSGLNDLARNPKNFMLFYGTNKRTFKSDDYCEDTVWSVFSWRMIYRKSFIDQYNLRFDTGIKSGEDRIFIFNVLLNADKIAVNDDLYGYYYYIRGVNSLTGVKNLKAYRTGLFEHYDYFDKVEQDICSRNSFLSQIDLKRIRLERANKMRLEVVLNEFRYNKNNAIQNMKNYINTDFFQFSYGKDSYIYVKEHCSKKELVKFILIKYHFFYILKMFY